VAGITPFVIGHESGGRIMKMLDEVAVVCDHRTVESALALRGVLEHFRLRARLHRLVEHREALDFFAGSAPSSPYTVLMSMATTGQESPGSGTYFDSFEGGLRFDVFETGYGDAEATVVVGRHPVFVDLTPSTIPNLVTAAGGTLVAVAGQEPLLQGPWQRIEPTEWNVAPSFLAAGYDAVIAPTESGQDYNAALLFTIGFFYFAMSEHAVYSDEEAVAQAATLANANRDGTNGYRYYKRAA
jgi:hypothetical protein